MILFIIKHLDWISQQKEQIGNMIESLDNGSIHNVKGMLKYIMDNKNETGWTKLKSGSEETKNIYANLNLLIEKNIIVNKMMIDVKMKNGLIEELISE